MSGLLRGFDPESADEETRRLSRLAQSCWSPLAIIYDPLKAGSIDSTDTVPHDKAIVRAQNADFTPNKRIKGKPECTIFVGNLSPTTSEKSLKEEFSRYGRVVKATLVEDIITGRSRGYGFIEYSLECEAAKAYESAHRSWLDGNKLIVDMECSRLLPGWVPRRLGGGFNGRKESGQLRFGCRERPFRKPIKLLTESEMMRVYEKTMGKKLSGSVRGNAESRESSKPKESTSVKVKDEIGESEVSGRDKKSENHRQDKEIKFEESEGQSGGESMKHVRGSEYRSKERESKGHKTHKHKRKHDKKKKKKRRRSRSQSNTSEEERQRKHEHHKRRKEHSRD